ncbi:unnamed protein product [Meganyctiphanes norvegica]|uniref:Uncharacterized protein n=1 Tax=Meganyctiphanes norvegica TaxID=48144 RepID=A0AAV2R1N4_MEGNR
MSSQKSKTSSKDKEDKNLEKMQKEEISKIDTNLETCRDYLNRLSQHKEAMEVQKVLHCHQKAELEKVIARHQQALDSVHHDLKKLNNMLTEGHGLCKYLEESRKQILGTDTMSLVHVAGEDAQQRYVATQALSTYSVTTLLENGTIKVSNELTGLTATALANLAEVRTLNAIQEEDELKGPSTGPPRRASEIVGEGGQLTMRQLKEALQISKLGGRGVYAMLDSTGRSRAAELKLVDGRIMMYHLTDFDPPKSALTVQFADVRALVRQATALAFLEVGWGSSEQKGTVYVRVLGSTLMAKHFLLMCTGERGPSYAKTHFNSVLNKGYPAERVRGGDYDGKGGKPLMESLGCGGVIGHVKRGHVVGGMMDNDSAQFCIYTKEEPHVATYAFAMVEKGLELMREIANIDDVTKAQVTDCGICIGG